MTIRDLISASGMSQRAFAEYLAIPRRTVENWCMDVNKCPPYLVSLIEYKLRHEGLLK